MSIKPTATATSSAQDLLAVGPRPWRAACSLVAEAAAEVAHAHAKGLLHLSLSPALIALDERGRYDGILEEPERGETASALNYTAPEVFADVVPNERADVYSLAAILLALLRGQTPFSAQNRSAQATIVRVVRDAPDLTVADAPQELIALLEVALRKDPSQRQLSAAEFARATQAMAVGRSVTVSTQTTTTTPTPDAAASTAGPRINWVAGGLAVTLFFGVIFVGAVAAKMQGGDDVGVELVRSEVRAIPEAGGAGSTTSVVVPTTAPAPQPDEAADPVEVVAGVDTASTPDSDAPSTAAAFLSQLDAAVETTVPADPDTSLTIVPILKSVLDEFDLTLSDDVDANVLVNDTLGGRDATVALMADALLPPGFLLAPNGRLFGVARECGVTETGYTITTSDGATSSTAIRIVVTGCP